MPMKLQLRYALVERVTLYSKLLKKYIPAICFLLLMVKCERLKAVWIFVRSIDDTCTSVISLLLAFLQDWIWSVGCNPFSITSQGWHISQFQSDTIARSYIITTLDESIQVVNSAIHLLLMERTCILCTVLAYE